MTITKNVYLLKLMQKMAEILSQATRKGTYDANVLWVDRLKVPGNL